MIPHAVSPDDGRPGARVLRKSQNLDNLFRCAELQITNVNAKGAFFFLREAGRTLSNGGKIIT